jgi:hypothetical protein
MVDFGCNTHMSWSNPRTFLYVHILHRKCVIGVRFEVLVSDYADVFCSVIPYTRWFKYDRDKL